jgi:hypothetical protein
LRSSVVRRLKVVLGEFPISYISYILDLKKGFIKINNLSTRKKEIFLQQNNYRREILSCQEVGTCTSLSVVRTNKFDGNSISFNGHDFFKLSTKSQQRVNKKS